MTTRAERIEAAAKLLAAHVEAYHDGDPDCWVCRGWMPDEHDKDCALVALRAALSAPEEGDAKLAANSAPASPRPEEPGRLFGVYKRCPLCKHPAPSPRAQPEETARLPERIGRWPAARRPDHA